MLGIESPRKPISGKFAKELREALVRARTGNLIFSSVVFICNGIMLYCAIFQ